MAPTGKSRGFSLIEIMVVVTIIGIVMSVMVLSLSLVGDDREVHKQARRFMTLLDISQDEAMMQGREFGIELILDGYRFVEFDPASGQWAEIEFDDTLKLTRLPDGFELSLYLEDKRVLLEPEPAKLMYDDRPGAPPNNYSPQLLVYSSGATTPFDLTITRIYDQTLVQIEGDLLGNVEILELDERL
jgi:general secretion pathway protein H